MAERETGQLDAVDGSGAPADGKVATSFLQRAVVRRRVRFLRRRRELALHDLGGFVFESHRLGEAREELLNEKLTALGALDDELSTLQRALELREEVTVLREPGIASCAHCGAIHDSAANFCPNCGLPAGGAAAPTAQASPAEATESDEEAPPRTDGEATPQEQAAPEEPASPATADREEAPPRTAAVLEPAAPAAREEAPSQTDGQAAQRERGAPAEAIAAQEGSPPQAHGDTAPLEAAQ